MDSIGISILTNLDTNFGVFAAAFYAVDTLLGLPPLLGMDWNAFYLKVWAILQQASAEAMQKLYSERQTGTTPSHNLSEYAGLYSNPAYGDLIIGPPTNGNLTLSYYVFSDLTLLHWQYDTFLSLPSESYYSFSSLFTFQSDPYTGDIASVTTPFQGPIQFMKVQ